jgi:hypothetical protein
MGLIKVANIIGLGFLIFGLPLIQALISQTHTCWPIVKLCFVAKMMFNSIFTYNCKYFLNTVINLVGFYFIEDTIQISKDK